MKKILIIAPHADDEILSFGGYMINQIAEGAEVIVRIGTIGGTHILQPFKERFAEFESVMNALGVTDYDFMYQDADAIMDSIPTKELASKIDNLIDTIHPDEVFCCYPSVHQDHKAIFDAFMVSMRLRDGFLPNFVAFGEYPFILTATSVPFNGKFYHPLSREVLDKKIKLFELYKSQLRKSPSPLGSRGVKILATTRGLECGQEYAEIGRAHV